MTAKGLRTVRSALDGVDLSAGPYPGAGGKRAKAAWLKKLDDDLGRVNDVLRETFGVALEVVTAKAKALDVRLVDADGTARPRSDRDKVLDLISGRLEEKRDADWLIWATDSALAEAEPSDTFYEKCRVIRLGREVVVRVDVPGALAALRELRVTVRAFPKSSSARTAWLKDLDAGLTAVNRALAPHGPQIHITLNYHPAVSKPEIEVPGVSRGKRELLALVSERLVPGEPGLVDSLRLAMTPDTADEGFFEGFESLKFGFDS